MSYTTKQYLNKQKTLNFFTKRLFANGLKKKIGKMILFGSFAKGTANRNSDIDLIIFIKGRKSRAIEDVIDQLSFDSTVKYGESVEPLIYSYAKYKKPDSPFLKEILQYGKEIII